MLQRPRRVVLLSLSALLACGPSLLRAQSGAPAVLSRWSICLWPGYFEQQGCGELTVLADTAVTPFGGPGYLRGRHSVDLGRLVNILIRREPCATMVPSEGIVQIQLSPRGCGRSADDQSLVAWGELRGDTVRGSWEVTCNPACAVAGRFRMTRLRDQPSIPGPATRSS